MYCTIVSGDQSSIKMRSRCSARVAGGAPKQAETSDLEGPSKNQRSERDEQQNGMHAELGGRDADARTDELFTTWSIVPVRTMCFHIKTEALSS